MSSPFPAADATFGNLHVGDTRDDDAQVVDNFLIEVDAPPPVQDLIGPIDPAPLVKPKITTRLVTMTYNVASTWQPFRLLTADPTRVQLRIKGFSTAASPTGVNEYVSVAYDGGMTGTPSATYHLRHGEGMNLDEHTGELWIAPNSSLDAATYFEVTVVAVTGAPGNV